VQNLAHESGITYQGIFKNFAELRLSGETVTRYVNQNWLKTEELKLENTLKNFNLNLDIEGNYRDRDLLLVLAGMNLDNVKILDVGPGFAGTFFYLKKNYKKCFNYTAVDLEEIVFILNNQTTNYHDFKACDASSIPHMSFNLIYFGSSLQYIEDYEIFLDQICQLRARTLYISDTPMGDVKTFVTIQVNMEDRRLPRWVFNRKELIDLLQIYGYFLVSESLVDWHQEIHNFSNFPPEYQKIKHRNLVFELKD